MYAIETKHLNKQYDKFQALNDVNLQVPKGSIYGFIGLNGAGKTTTMRTLLNMIRPSSGTAMLLGEDVRKVSSNFWNKVGYLIETPQSYSSLTTYENLEIYAQLREIPRHELKPRIDQFLEELQLTPYRDKPVKELSLGNRQKIGIVKALIHRPEILLLDEPTNGLDPQGLNQVRLLLQRLAHDEGATILISSHILAEMEQMLTHIGVLSHGKLIEQESYSDFTNHIEQQVVASFQNNEELIAAHGLLDNNGIINSINNNNLVIPDIKNIRSTISLLTNHSIIPTSWHPNSNGLEEYFLNLLDEEESSHEFKLN
ncbi:ABC transporter ATP-binding protein [Lentilactobacillus kosonis]|uniref:Bacitracin transport ATP-binding protein bcrA n=1 Tax=Lentilactobacillus kosonis TaxID=2810561 RepID=A0A401FHZ3_9LACO|nr:ABC transporter ATP-binding protein [Lentilactobacillus kosonis]GAY71972.1 bacitracin transport ATP-binding protein bcrA [Lentilactobacillus kosonis]